MYKTILTLFTGLASVSTFSQQPDLLVFEISAPEYDESIDGTTFTVVIINKGKSDAENVSVKVMGLDLTPEDAKENWNAKQEDMWLFSENMSNSEEGAVDSDEDWEQDHTIAKIKAGEKAILKIEIKDYWVFDPNCEIGVIVDPAKTIEEDNETNNQRGFFAGG